MAKQSLIRSTSFVCFFLISCGYYLFLCSTVLAEEGGISIEFMARPTSPIIGHTPGHVFLCITLDLAGGSKEECFGFYPQSPAMALDGPGNLSNEFTKAAIQNVSVSLKHAINESTRAAIYGEIRKWAGADYKS